MHHYEFGEFRLYPSTRKIFRQYIELEIRDRDFDVLLHFLTNSPRVLSKDEIISAVWKGTAVEDNSVERAVVNIRKLLGDDASDPRYIKTVRGRGYLFICGVERHENKKQTEVSFDGVSNPGGSKSQSRLVTPALKIVAALAILVVAGFAAWKGLDVYDSLAETSVFEDDFGNDSLDNRKWQWSGKKVSLSDGVAKISVDKMDNGGKLLSSPFGFDPEKPLTVRSRIKVSFNQNIEEYVQFEGVFGLVAGKYLNKDNPGTFYGVKYGNAVTTFKKEGRVTTQGFYLIRDNGDILEEYHHCNGRVGPKASAIWGKWFDQTIVYDPQNGTLALLIDGVKKGEFAIGKLAVGEEPTLRLVIYPRGAWLHHSIEIDDLSVTQ